MAQKKEILIKMYTNTGTQVQRTFYMLKLYSGADAQRNGTSKQIIFLCLAFQKHNFPVHLMEVNTTHICNCTLTLNSNCDADAQCNGQSKQIIFLCLYAMTYMSVQ